MNKSLIYIIRRFSFYLIAAFAALTLNFIIPRLMPGDPASIIFARFKGKLKPEAIDAMRESFGLTNDPILVQYISYLKGILKGDLGTSIAYFPEPVSEIIGNGLYWTIFLAGSSLIIAFLIGNFGHAMKQIIEKKLMTLSIIFTLIVIIVAFLVYKFLINFIT